MHTLGKWSGSDPSVGSISGPVDKGKGAKDEVGTSAMGRPCRLWGKMVNLFSGCWQVIEGLN